MKLIDWICVGCRYDLSLRFRTTLPNGLLAVGQGQTFYRLELSNGQLNLHSSLLNKWEGVFLGNNLNDAEWQTIRVRFNLTHLHLVVNQQVNSPLSFSFYLTAL